MSRLLHRSCDSRFSELLELFQGQRSKPQVISELFWASLHGIAELTRTKRFPRSRQKERVLAECWHRKASAKRPCATCNLPCSTDSPPISRATCKNSRLSDLSMETQGSNHSPPFPDNGVRL